jgi:hypothetical protein
MRRSAGPLADLIAFLESAFDVAVDLGSRGGRTENKVLVSQRSSVTGAAATDSG